MALGEVSCDYYQVPLDPETAMNVVLVFVVVLLGVVVIRFSK